MHRVSTLLKKIQKQLDDGAAPEALLPTVQLLQSEILQHVSKNIPPLPAKIAVSLPLGFHLNYSNASPVAENEEIKEEDKVVELLKVDEKEVQAELDQMKKNADSINTLRSHGKPQFLFDPLEDVPTLAQQDPLSKTERPVSMDISSFEYPQSLNDKLKEVKIELSQSLTTSPIKDLKKAIGVNDRFLFINELFRGDEAMYERSIKTIQNFSNYAEAEFWIRRELKVKIGWEDNDPVVREFDLLVKRKFS